MEKLRNVYFYIDTKAYVANAALKADPEVVERFYQESREALWDIGFGTGKDWAQKGNEMLSIGVMAISGNIRADHPGIGTDTKKQAVFPVYEI